jgi:hypothetical protein
VSNLLSRRQAWSGFPMHKVNPRPLLPGHREHNFLVIQAFLHSKGPPPLSRLKPPAILS